MEDLKLSSIIRNIQEDNYEDDTKSTEKSYSFIRIICTIGPSSFSVEVLENLIMNYVDIICLDMSYNYDYKFCYNLIKKIRNIECNLRRKNQWRPLIDIAIKIRGREIRTGLVSTTTESSKLSSSKTPSLLLSSSQSSNFIELQRNQIIELTTDKNYYAIGNENIIYVNYKNITSVIKSTNQIIVIGEDIEYRIVLIVKQIKSNSLICMVKTPNILRSLQKVYLPGVRINISDIVDDTIKDLKFAKYAGISIIFTSHIRDPNTIHEIRKILDEDNNHPSDDNRSSSSSSPLSTVLANISDLDSLENFDALIAAADGIILNRNELAIEFPKQKIFIIQKSISAKCNRAGKICVFTAPILNSMRRNLIPTIIEISDVRNVILDGVDCILLNYETSTGDYPIETCKIIKDISVETKSSIIESKTLRSITIKDMYVKNETEAIIMAALNIAIQCNAACIISITITGKSARSLAKCNPPCPIIAVTQEIGVARKLFLYRGIWPVWPKIPVLYRFDKWMTNMEKTVEVALDFGTKMNIIRNGDCIIVTSGWGEDCRTMNTIRVLYAHLSDEILLQKSKKK